MHSVTAADGTKANVECLACAIAKREVEVLGGIIAETENFHLANDFEDPIPGFLILASKEHKRSLADFTAEQNVEMISLLARARQALRDVLNIEQVTIIQEEKTANSHFHVWLFPWHDWMQEIGSRLGSIPAIKEYARANHATAEVRQKIIAASEKLRVALRS